MHIRKTSLTVLLVSIFFRLAAAGSGVTPNTTRILGVPNWSTVGVSESGVTSVLEVGDRSGQRPPLFPFADSGRTTHQVREGERETMDPIRHAGRNHYDSPRQPFLS